MSVVTDLRICSATYPVTSWPLWKRDSCPNDTFTVCRWQFRYSDYNISNNSVLKLAYKYIEKSRFCLFFFLFSPSRPLQGMACGSLWLLLQLQIMMQFLVNPNVTFCWVLFLLHWATPAGKWKPKLFSMSRWTTTLLFLGKSINLLVNYIPSMLYLHHDVFFFFFF